MKLILVLNNIRSTYNVGAILRTAEGLGIAAVVLSGYTPRYQDPQLLPHLREKLNRQINKSALGAEEMVQQVLVDDLPSWIKEQAANGALVLGLENNLGPSDSQRRLILGGAALQSLLDRAAGSNASKPARAIILVLGEEVHGIPSEIRALCDYFVEIPMAGRKESFNVSVAASIALWDLLRQSNMVE